MRLDKFLKVSRIIKRRSVAKEVIGQDRVKINGQIAKPGTKVAIGDEIELEFGQKFLTVKVLDIKDTSKKAEASGMFEVVKEEFKE